MKSRTRPAIVGALLVAVTGTVATYLVFRHGSQHPLGTGSLGSAPLQATVLGATPRGSRPDLWVFSIGISHYRESAIGLRFADADARAVAEELQAQEHLPLYRNVHQLVLTNDQVTRKTIIDGFKAFLGKAGPDDVTAIFMAGHGVQDPVTGSYYFLPYPASADNLDSEGLRMSDFDEMTKRLRHNVHRVVVMLDTCHAGALQLSSLRTVSGDDLAKSLKAAEGLFVLAAAKKGEESTEKDDLAHGAFTYALLEGLQGSADSEHKGVIYVGDLFHYVARRVPLLTNGSQHPYEMNEGTDLIFAIPTTSEVAAEAAGAPDVVAETLRTAPSGSAPSNPSVIEVWDFQNSRPDDHGNDWIGTTLSNALCTELSGIDQLKGSVYCTPGPSGRRGASKVVTGSFVVDGAEMRVDVHMRAAGGATLSSVKKVGKREGALSLVSDIAREMAERLQVEVLQQPERQAEKAGLDRYKQVLEGEDVIPAPEASGQTPVPSPRGPAQTQSEGGNGGQRGTSAGPGAAHPASVSQGAQSSIFTILAPRVAYAAEPPSDVRAAVEGTLQEYKSALEHKDLDRLASLYVSFSDRQRQSVRAYFESIEQLTVEISDVSIVGHGTDFEVSYTRHDRFIDKETGKPARVDVRLTKLIVRAGDRWKIAGGS